MGNMFRSINLCLSLLLFTLFRLGFSQIRDDAFNYPPLFSNLSSKWSLQAVEGAKLAWPCKTQARPASTYTWYHNDQPISGNHYQLRGKIGYDPAEGTLYIVASFNTIGQYYCRASNELLAKQFVQTATIDLQLAYFSSFPHTEGVSLITASPGSYQRFVCDPPVNEPRSHFYWEAGDETLNHPRFFTDPNSGDLLLLSVTDGIEAAAVGVRCCTTNPIAKVHMCGSLHRLELSADPAVESAPTLRFLTNASDAVFDAGDAAASIACVFSSYPLAQVEWRRTDGAPVVFTAGNDTVYQNVLAFTEVNSQIAGTYQCRGVNRLGTSDWYSVTVTVRSRPALIDTFDQAVTLRPYDGSFMPPVGPTLQPTALPDNMQVGLVNLTVGDSVTLGCGCQAMPAPVVSWYLNGISIDTGIANSPMLQRILMRGSVLELNMAQLSDNGNVLECRCSNIVGRAVRMFGLLVFERTRIVERPQPSPKGYRPVSDSDPNSLVIDLDGDVALNKGLQLFYERSTLRCGARTDPATQLTLGWWNRETNATLPLVDSSDSSIANAVADVDADVEVAAGVADAEWLIRSATPRLIADTTVTIATIDVQKLLGVAWNRRATQRIFRLSLDCRAGNTLSRTNVAINLMINTTNYIRWRFAKLNPNSTMEIAAVLDVVSEPSVASFNWWIIAVVAACCFILFAVIFLTVFCVRRNRGASYQLEKHELATGRDPLSELRASGFAPLIRQNDVVKGRLFESLEQALAGDSDEMSPDRAKAALLDDDDAFVNEYEKGDTGKFSPDGAALSLFAVNRSATLYRRDPPQTPSGLFEMSATSTNADVSIMARSVNGALPGSNRSSVERSNAMALAIAEPRQSLITFSPAANTSRSSGFMNNSTDTPSEHSSLV